MPPRLRAQQAPVEAEEITKLKAELQTLSRTRTTQDVSGRYSRLHSAATCAEVDKLDGSQLATILALLAAAYGAVGRSIVSTAGANLRVWAFLSSELRERCDPQLVLALLRSDTLSLLAQICSALGTADSGDAASPSTSGSSAFPRSVQVVIVGQVSYMLYSIVSKANAGQSAMLSELLTALARSQLLEHLTAAILRLAAVLPPDVRGSGNPDAALVRLRNAGQQPSAAFDAEADWACLCLAVEAVCLSGVLLVYPKNLAVDFSSLVHPAYSEADSEQLAYVSQLRTLLSGRCVQWFLVWALQAACLGAAASMVPAAAAAAAGPGPSGPDAPQQEVPRFLPLRLASAPAALPAAGTPMAACATVVAAVALAFHVTVSGRGHLPIAQPPVGYRPAATPMQHASGAAAADAGADASSTAANAGAVGSGRAASHDAPNRAVAVYNLIKAAWPGFYGMDSGIGGAGDGGSDGGGTRVFTSAATPLLCRLVTELRPRQAAARLPGLWREVLVPEVGIIFSVGHDISMGELLRLQVPAPPLAAGVPPPSAAGASSYSTYSLRCALDAGLLPALERVLRNEQAWAIGIPDGSDLSNGPGSASSTGPQPDTHNVFHVLHEINSSLRYSGLWPAALSHAPPEQVVGLVATLTAAARWLSQRPPVMPRGRPLAGRLNKMMPYQGDAMGLLCGNLAALLEQGLDLAEDAAAEGSTAVSVAGAPAGSSGHSRRRRYLRLNDALEAPMSAPMQWPWLVAAGGTPPAGSAAAAQRDWLLSFAALQWLPLLMEVVGTVHDNVKQETAADGEETAADGGATGLNSIGLETTAVVLRVAGEVLAAAAMAQEEARLRGTDGASGSKGQAAAGRVGADPAQQQQQQPTSADVFRQTNAQAQHDPNTSNLHAELPSNAQLHLDSWQPALVALLDGGHLLQLVGYFATHTEKWAGVSCSTSSGTGNTLSNGATGDTDSIDCADKRPQGDAQQAEGSADAAGLEGCVLDALEAFWAHRPQACPDLMLSRARNLGQAQAVTAKSGDVGSSSWPGNTDSSCSSGSRNPSDGSSAPAQQVVLDKALWDLSPLREVAARHGRSELVQLVDAASADVAVALANADTEAAAAGGEEGVGILVDVSCSQLRRRLLRRRYRDATEGAIGGATGCHPPCAWRLLSPYEVRQQVDAALATAAAAVAPAAATSSAGAASGSGGGGAASVAAAAVTPAALCANPSCSSLDGPSALVPPGGGKTCSRCRAARYCCGLCQLQHWRKGGHATQCPGVVTVVPSLGLTT